MNNRCGTLAQLLRAYALGSPSISEAAVPVSQTVRPSMRGLLRFWRGLEL